MVFAGRKIVAKDGTIYDARSPEVAEAKTLSELMVEVAYHSPYILGTPETFKQKSLENQEKWIHEARENADEAILALYFEDRMIGLCNARSFKDIKRRHRAGLGISLHQDFRGKGLGHQLMLILIEEMKKFPHIKIIELDVMTNNTSAVELYRNLGFKEAGRFPNAYILTTGEVSDNLAMYLEVFG